MNRLYPTNGSANDQLAEAVTQRLMDPDYVRDHLRLSIRKKGADVTCEEIRKDFLDLELVLKIDLDFMSDQTSSAAVKVTKSVLDVCQITEEQAFEQAAQNLEEEVYTGTLSEILFGKKDEIESMFYIISTGKPGAAAALTSTKVFADLCEKTGAEKGCLILPSSSEELLAIPENEDGDPERDLEFAAMVGAINSEIVEPRIQLLPTVYRYSIADNSIRIAATLA